VFGSLLVRAPAELKRSPVADDSKRAAFVRHFIDIAAG